jgi:hypothetical protein
MSTQIVRALDGNGDWTFGQGFNNYLSYNYEIAQEIQTQLNMFLGDCFFDLTAGIDWWNLLGAKNEDLILLFVAATIANVKGVTGILNLSTTLDDNRNLSIQYSVTTIYQQNITATAQLLLDEQGNFLTTEQGDALHA